MVGRAQALGPGAHMPPVVAVRERGPGAWWVPEVSLLLTPRPSWVPATGTHVTPGRRRVARPG